MMSYNLTSQEIFDKVATHLFTQARQAVDDYGTCQYRITIDKEKYSCAVGCLIDDEDYTEHLEGNGVGALHRLGLLHGQLKDFITKNYTLLANLQGVHDTNYDWIDSRVLRSKLKTVTQNCNLSYALLESLNFPETHNAKQA